MNLVAYSDSESDSETNPVQEQPAKSEKSSTKPAPKVAKLIDRANPSKIKVSLPSATDTTADDADTRPAKRARTGGGLNISAFLPAPKNTGPKARGLGRGVNLKTGATPAFERNAA